MKEKLYDATDLNISFEQGRLRGEKDIKDVLMDWLIEQRDNAASLDDQFVPNAIGEYEAYQETIDKLNSL